MSLYLGKIGRKILNYTVTHPRINSVVDVFGKMANGVTFGIYTPGLTREAFLLYQRTLPGDKISVEDDGFYRKGIKIAGNNHISTRVQLYGGPDNLQRTIDMGPEAIAKFARSFGTAKSYLKPFKLAVIATALFSCPDILLRIAAKATMPEAIEDWDYYGQTNRLFINLHHHVPWTSGFGGVVTGFVGLLTTGFFAHRVQSEASLRNLNTVAGPIYAAGALINGVEVLINGYATDYINLPGKIVANLADGMSFLGSIMLVTLGFHMFFYLKPR